jgi:hypothetical protein
VVGRAVAAVVDRVAVVGAGVAAVAVAKAAAGNAENF